MADNFFTYLKRIKFTVGETDYLVPIWNLTVGARPWSGTGATATRLFDGRSVQKIMGWRYHASMNMNFGFGGADNVIFLALLNALATGETLVVDFDPDDDPGTKTMTLIAEDANEAAQAIFSGHIRNRPASISMISPTVAATKPDWLTEHGAVDPPDPEPEPEPAVVQFIYYLAPPNSSAELRRFVIE